ncbi:unnamed protein product [Rotaria socialis]|uniref:Gag-like protein n=1 Tax=Rotaria socialis TaxID=392032 RepID=A0A821QFT6_9BILA|nr:unnamed protein product [Rotaria socialis]CAF4820600.1 unnamed protein product [Rotaria socialis]
MATIVKVKLTVAPTKTLPSKDIVTNLLSHIIKLKYSRLDKPQHHDFYIVTTKEPEILDTKTATESLKTIGLKVHINAQSKSQQTIFINQLDSCITTKYTIPEILKEIEGKNTGMTVSQIFPINGSPRCLKVILAQPEMAKKAIESGLNLFHYTIFPEQITIEQYTHVLTCFKCYKLDSHTTQKCPTPEVTLCSQCSSPKHTYRNCVTTTRKCLNCKQNHTTMAPFCPARKQIIKEKNREILTNEETTQHTTDSTVTSDSSSPTSTFTTTPHISYAQMASSSTTQRTPSHQNFVFPQKIPLLPLPQQFRPIPQQTNSKLPQQATTVNQPPNNTIFNIPQPSSPQEIPSFANIAACMIYAHIENTIYPGTFNKTLHEIFKANKLHVTLQFPENPKSSQQVLNKTKQSNTSSTSGDTSTDTSTTSEKTLTTEEEIILEDSFEKLSSSTPHSSPKPPTPTSSSNKPHTPNKASTKPPTPNKASTKPPTSPKLNLEKKSTVAEGQATKTIQSPLRSTRLNPSKTFPSTRQNQKIPNKEAHTINLALYTTKNSTPITEIDTLVKQIKANKVKFTYDAELTVSDVITQISQNKITLYTGDFTPLDIEQFNTLTNSRLQKTTQTTPPHNE